MKKIKSFFDFKDEIQALVFITAVIIL